MPRLKRHFDGAHRIDPTDLCSGTTLYPHNQCLVTHHNAAFPRWNVFAHDDSDRSARQDGSSAAFVFDTTPELIGSRIPISRPSSYQNFETPGRIGRHDHGLRNTVKKKTGWRSIGRYSAA